MKKTGYFNIELGKYNCLNCGKAFTFDEVYKINLNAKFNTNYLCKACIPESLKAMIAKHQKHVKR